MKLVDELIITNRWDADSKHKSQYSGIQYYKSYRHNVSLSGYLVCDNAINYVWTLINELKKGHLFMFHAAKRCIYKKHCLKSQIKSKRMAHNKNSTNWHQNDSQVHFSMSIAWLNICSCFSYTSENSNNHQKIMCANDVDYWINISILYIYINSLIISYLYIW